MRRPLVLAAALIVACGIDAVGTKIDESGTIPGGPDGTSPTADGDPATTDANGADGSNDLDATTDADASTASDADADAKPLPGPLCPTNAAGLIACFAFENSTSDQSPANTQPTTAANVGYAAGHEGQAAVFTTSPKTDVRLPSAGMNTTAMTIEMWLRPAPLPGSGARYLLVDMEGRFGVTLQSDGAMRCRSLEATTKATAGVWHHLACVNDGAEMRVYVDGKLEGSVANVLGTTSDFIGIGEDSTSATETFVGMMDNLRIWTRALSAGEVSSAAAR